MRPFACFWEDRVPIALCEDAIEQGLAFIDEFTDGRQLFHEAFSLACIARHSVYDLLYLILARRHDAVLLSADALLRELAARYGIRAPGDDHE